MRLPPPPRLPHGQIAAACRKPSSTGLCAVHRCPEKIGGTGTASGWDLVLEDYRRIRRRILANGAVMQRTTMQLVDVSPPTTLVQWHQGAR